MERLCFVRFLCNSGITVHGHDSCCPMLSSVCIVLFDIVFLFHFGTVLSVLLWFMASDYSFGTFVSSNFSFFLVTYLDKSETSNICKGRVIFSKYQQSMYYLDTSSLDLYSSKRTSTRISELRDYNYSPWKVKRNKYKNVKCRKGDLHI